MSEMVERVAMALAADIEEGFPRFTQQRWDALTELARATMRQRARVAIAAMREPTEAMIDAAYARMDEAAQATGNPKADWQAMIDEALK